MHSPELVKGTLQTIILKLLADHGRMYGYEITQKVRDLSDGSLIITEGALYPTLHRLESEGMLSTEKEHIGKRVRKYYKLTPSGQSSVTARIDEFENFVRTMFILLKLNPQRV